MNDFPENSSWKSACCLIPILQNHSHVIQRPFYQMSLKPLDVEKYKEFATAKFEEVQH